MEVVVEQLHNTGSLLKVHIFSGSFGSAVERKGTRGIIYIIFGGSFGSAVDDKGANEPNESACSVDG